MATESKDSSHSLMSTFQALSSSYDFRNIINAKDDSQDDVPNKEQSLEYVLKKEYLCLSEMSSPENLANSLEIAVVQILTSTYYIDDLDQLYENDESYEVVKLKSKLKDHRANFSKEKILQYLMEIKQILHTSYEVRMFEENGIGWGILLIQDNISNTIWLNPINKKFQVIVPVSSRFPSLKHAFMDLFNEIKSKKEFYNLIKSTLITLDEKELPEFLDKVLERFGRVCNFGEFYKFLELFDCLLLKNSLFKSLQQVTTELKKPKYQISFLFDSKVEFKDCLDRAVDQITNDRILENVQKLEAVGEEKRAAQDAICDLNVKIEKESEISKNLELKYAECQRKLLEIRNKKGEKEKAQNSLQKTQNLIDEEKNKLSMEIEKSGQEAEKVSSEITKARIQEQELKSSVANFEYEEHKLQEELLKYTAEKTKLKEHSLKLAVKLSWKRFLIEMSDFIPPFKKRQNIDSFIEENKSRNLKFLVENLFQFFSLSWNESGRSELKSYICSYDKSKDKEALLNTLKTFINPPILDWNVQTKTLEVKAKSLVFSDIFENLPKMDGYTELRILCPIIYLDKDFKRTGFNIAIVSNSIFVTEEIIIDVSGKNAKALKEHRAMSGNSSSPDGTNGADGENGTSGGNVYISAYRVIDSKKLTIKSNGGNGASGQSGGHGADGRQGKDGPDGCINRDDKEYYQYSLGKAGEMGRTGGDGGHAGLGGKGAPEGRIELDFPNAENVIIENECGQDGDDGERGYGGDGGLGGRKGVNHYRAWTITGWSILHAEFFEKKGILKEFKQQKNVTGTTWGYEILLEKTENEARKSNERAERGQMGDRGQTAAERRRHKKIATPTKKEKINTAEIKSKYKAIQQNLSQGASKSEVDEIINKLNSMEQESKNLEAVDKQLKSKKSQAESNKKKSKTRLGELNSEIQKKAQIKENKEKTSEQSKSQVQELEEKATKLKINQNEIAGALNNIAASLTVAEFQKMYKLEQVETQHHLQKSLDTKLKQKKALEEKKEAEIRQTNLKIEKLKRQHEDMMQKLKTYQIQKVQTTHTVNRVHEFDPNRDNKYFRNDFINVEAQVFIEPERTLSLPNSLNNVHNLLEEFKNTVFDFQFKEDIEMFKVEIVRDYSQEEEMHKTLEKILQSRLENPKSMRKILDSFHKILLQDINFHLEMEKKNKAQCEKKLITYDKMKGFHNELKSIFGIDESVDVSNILELMTSIRENPLPCSTLEKYDFIKRGNPDSIKFLILEYINEIQEKEISKQIPTELVQLVQKSNPSLTPIIQYQIHLKLKEEDSDTSELMEKFVMKLFNVKDSYRMKLLKKSRISSLYDFLKEALTKDDLELNEQIVCVICLKYLKFNEDQLDTIKLSVEKKEKLETGESKKLKLQQIKSELNLHFCRNFQENFLAQTAANFKNVNMTLLRSIVEDDLAYKEFDFKEKVKFFNSFMKLKDSRDDCNKKIQEFLMKVGGYRKLDLQPKALIESYNKLLKDKNVNSYQILNSLIYLFSHKNTKEYEIQLTGILKKVIFNLKYSEKNLEIISRIHGFIDNIKSTFPDLPSTIVKLMVEIQQVIIDIIPKHVKSELEDYESNFVQLHRSMQTNKSKIFNILQEYINNSKEISQPIWELSRYTLMVMKLLFFAEDFNSKIQVTKKILKFLKENNPFNYDSVKIFLQDFENEIANLQSNFLQNTNYENSLEKLETQLGNIANVNPEDFEVQALNMFKSLLIVPRLTTKEIRTKYQKILQQCNSLLFPSSQSVPHENQLENIELNPYIKQTLAKINTVLSLEYDNNFRAMVQLLGNMETSNYNEELMKIKESEDLALNFVTETMKFQLKYDELDFSDFQNDLASIPALLKKCNEVNFTQDLLLNKVKVFKMLTADANYFSGNIFEIDSFNTSAKQFSKELHQKNSVNPKVQTCFLELCHDIFENTEVTSITSLRNVSMTLKNIEKYYQNSNDKDNLLKLEKIFELIFLYELRLLLKEFSSHPPYVQAAIFKIFSELDIICNIVYNNDYSQKSEIRSEILEKIVGLKLNANPHKEGEKILKDAFNNKLLKTSNFKVTSLIKGIGNSNNNQYADGLKHFLERKIPDEISTKKGLLLIYLNGNLSRIEKEHLLRLVQSSTLDLTIDERKRLRKFGILVQDSTIVPEERNRIIEKSEGKSEFTLNLLCITETETFLVQSIVNVGVEPDGILCLLQNLSPTLWAENLKTLIFEIYFEVILTNSNCNLSKLLESVKSNEALNGFLNQFFQVDVDYEDGTILEEINKIPENEEIKLELKLLLEFRLHFRNFYFVQSSTDSLNWIQWIQGFIQNISRIYPLTLLELKEIFKILSNVFYVDSFILLQNTFPENYLRDLSVLSLRKDLSGKIDDSPLSDMLLKVKFLKDSHVVSLVAWKIHKENQLNYSKSQLTQRFMEHLIETLYRANNFTSNLLGLLSSKSLFQWPNLIREKQLYEKWDDHSLVLMIISLENMLSADIVNKFLNLFDSKEDIRIVRECIQKFTKGIWTLDSQILSKLERLQKFYKDFDKKNTVFEVTTAIAKLKYKSKSRFKSSVKKLIESKRIILEEIEKYSVEIRKKERDSLELLRLIREDKQNDMIIGVLDNLYQQADKIKKKKEKNMLLDADKIKSWAKDFIDHEEKVDKTNVVDVLSVIFRGVHITYGHYPRDTQILALLLYLDAFIKGSKGRIAQISTGEGKTLITGMLALVQALSGCNVDVITSSTVLAEENSNYIKPLFDLFFEKPEVTNNCDKETASEDIRRERYRYKVIYGDAGSFQRDILLSDFFGKNIRMGRYIDSVIVDEVDSMLLDKGENILYLSHNIPELNFLRFVFIEIWNAIHAPDVLEGREQDISIVATYLRTRIEKDEITIPKCLQKFIDCRLITWIKNAYAASLLRENDNYIIQYEETEGYRVIIIDKDTGEEQMNMEWSNGLSQFLQLKHMDKIKPESLKAVFLSNLSFFRKYKNRIFGMSGTVGSKAEMDLMSYCYNIDFFILPRFKPRFCIEKPGKIGRSEEEWLNHIRISVQWEIKENRSILVICENVEATEKIKNALNKFDDLKNRITIYKSSFDSEFQNWNRNNELDPGKIIIATNLAGRGTDIKISAGLKRTGLHVILSYLPSNVRVEKQAFGRTARAGVPGSTEYIVQFDLFDGSHKISFEEIKKVRDEKEFERIEHIRTKSLQKIEMEEQLFNEFHKYYEGVITKMKEESGSKIQGVDVIQLQFLRNHWAVWLDSMGEKLSLVHLHKSEDIMDEFQAFSKEMDDQQHLKEGFANLPTELIQLARFKESQGLFTEAESLYNKIIEGEKDFSYIAFYYKAMTILQNDTTSSNNTRQKSKRYLKQSKQLILNKIESTELSTEILKLTSELRKKFGQSVFANRYEEQVKNELKIYAAIIANIEEAIGQPATEEYFKSQSFIFDKEKEAKELHDLIIPNEKICKPYRLTKRMIIENGKIKLKNPSSSSAHEVVSLSINLSYCEEEILKVLKTCENNELRKIVESDFKNIVKTREEFVKLLQHAGILSDPEVETIPIYANEIEELRLRNILEELKLGSDETSAIVDGIKLNKGKSALEFGITHFVDITGFSQIAEINKKLKESKIIEEAQLQKYKVAGDKLCWNEEKDAFDKLPNSLKEFEKIIFHIFVDTEAISARCTKTTEQSSNTNDSLNIQFKSEINWDDLMLPLTIEQGIEAIWKHIFSLGLIKHPKVNLQINNRRHDCLGTIKNSIEEMKPKIIEIYWKYHDEPLKGSETLDNSAASTEEKEVVESTSAEKEVTTVSGPRGTFTKVVDNATEFVSDTKEVFGEFIKESKLAQAIITEVKESALVQMGIKAGTVIKDGAVVAVEYFSEDPKVTAENHYTESVFQCVLDAAGALKNIDDRIELFERSLEDSFVNEKKYPKELEEFHQIKFDKLYEFKKARPFWDWRALVVALFGVMQIFIGVAIEVFTLGAGTVVASGFFSEGISDIYFALMSMSNRNFSWKNYFNHKKVSLLITVITCGIGAYFAKGVQMSKFMGLSGMMLFRAVGMRIALKTLEAVGFALSDIAIEKLLSELRIKILNMFRSNINDLVGVVLQEKLNAIKDKMNTIYQKCPSFAEAKQRIDAAWRDLFSENGSSFLNNLSSHIGTFLSEFQTKLGLAATLRQNYDQHLKSMGVTNQNRYTQMTAKLLKYTKYVSQAFTYATTVFAKLKQAVTLLLDQSVNKIDHKLFGEVHKKGTSKENSDKEISSEFIQYRDTLLKQLKSGVSENLLLSLQGVVKPFLQKWSRSILSKVGKLALCHCESFQKDIINRVTEATEERTQQNVQKYFDEGLQSEMINSESKLNTLDKANEGITLKDIKDIYSKEAKSYRENGKLKIQIPSYQNFISNIGKGEKANFFSLVCTSKALNASIVVKREGYPDTVISPGISSEGTPKNLTKTITLFYKNDHYYPVVEGKIVELPPDTKFDNNCFFQATTFAMNQGKCSQADVHEMQNNIQNYAEKCPEMRDLYEDGAIQYQNRDLIGGANFETKHYSNTRRKEIDIEWIKNDFKLRNKNMNQELINRNVHTVVIDTKNHTMLGDIKSTTVTSLEYPNTIDPRIQLFWTQGSYLLYKIENGKYYVGHGRFQFARDNLGQPIHFEGSDPNMKWEQLRNGQSYDRFKKRKN